MKTKQLIYDNKGNSNLIAAVIGTLIILMVLAISLGGLQYASKYQTLNNFAYELVTTASQYGRCSGAYINRRYNELKKSTRLNPTFEFTANYFDETYKLVQYGDTITLKLTLKTKLVGFFDFSIPTTLIMTKQAQSEQYYK